jgi:hypothetical protein
MAHRKQTPIDTYWDLMKADRYDEAGALLLEHPDDASCVLERALRYRDDAENRGHIFRAAAMGNPIAMAYAGTYYDAEDMLDKARRSTSAYARALVYSHTAAAVLGDEDSIAHAEDLYREAIEQNESPRIWASYLMWVNGLPTTYLPSLEPCSHVARVAAVHGANLGIPYCMMKLAEHMDDNDPYSPERDKEIVRQLTRPALRESAAAMTILSSFYNESPESRDRVKSARLALALPATSNIYKIDRLARLIGPLTKAFDTVWEDCGAPGCECSGAELAVCCLYGRALVQGTLGLPCADTLVSSGPVTDLSNPLVRTMELMYSMTRVNGGDDTGDSGGTLGLLELLCHLTTPMPREEVHEVLARLVRLYRSWIEAIRNAVMEALLVLRAACPALPRDVALVIARTVWNAREDDAPMWCHVVREVSTRTAESESVAGGESSSKRARVA